MKDTSMDRRGGWGRRRRGPADLVIFVVIVGVLVPAGVWGLGIQAVVDRNEATTEDQIQLTITVEDSPAARPQLPELPQFEVVHRGRSSRVQIINGRMSTSMAYEYTLVPRQTGTFTIGAATVEIDGRLYASRPFQVKILDAASQPRQSRELFLTATVSDENPYVGEQVIYTWRFYRRVQVANAGVDPQQFEGFVVEELGDRVREYTTTVAGVRYAVSEIRKAIFPQEQGPLTVPGSRLSCDVLAQTRSRSFFDFGRTERLPQVLTSPPLEMTVRPLPPPPAGFSRLVGSFNIDSKISKRQLQVGESATLDLKVSGTGNVKMIGEPRLPELASFKIYDDKPTSSIDRTGSRLQGSKSFRKALVPLEQGQLAIPPIGLTYFDPTAEAYRTISTPALLLDVTPGSREELRLTESLAPTTGKVAVKILADDILPIYKGLDAVSGNGPLKLRGAVSWGGLMAPPMVFLGLLMLRRRRERFDLDAGLRRRRNALRKGLSELRQIDGTAGHGQSGAAQLASRCLREYVGDKLGVEGSALTPAEADALLRRHGVEDEVARKTHELLERCEAAQYGAPLGAGEGVKLVETLKPLLKQLDRQIASSSRRRTVKRQT